MIAMAMKISVMLVNVFSFSVHLLGPQYEVWSVKGVECGGERGRVGA